MSDVLLRPRRVHAQRQDLPYPAVDTTEKSPSFDIVSKTHAGAHSIGRPETVCLVA